LAIACVVSQEEPEGLWVEAVGENGGQISVELRGDPLNDEVLPTLLNRRVSAQDNDKLVRRAKNSIPEYHSLQRLSARRKNILNMRPGTKKMLLVVLTKGNFRRMWQLWWWGGGCRLLRYVGW
jgi:hypothetical protein